MTLMSRHIAISESTYPHFLLKAVIKFSVHVHFQHRASQLMQINQVLIQDFDRITVICANVVVISM